MSEWWTYDPAEMLMFAPAVYWRLVERYQQAVWPWPLVAPLLAVAAWLLLARGGSHRRLAWLVLAASWAWVGWAFHWQRYAEIFFGAPVLAIACGVEAALLIAAACWPRPDPAPLRPSTLGTVLVAAAVVGYPAVGLALGRPLTQAEFFGSMPDPTALATLGLLAGARGEPRWRRIVPAVIPALSLVWGWGTLWAMGR